MKLKYLFIIIVITLISGCSGTFEFEENEFENGIEYSADIELDGENYEGEVRVEEDSIEIELEEKNNEYGCSDTDGKNIYVKGVTKGLYFQDKINEGPLNYYDSCSACDEKMENCKMVTEYYCDNNKVNMIEKDCSQLCYNGACLNNETTVEQNPYDYEISVERLEGNKVYIKSSKKELNVELKINTCDSQSNLNLYEGINYIYLNNCEIIEGKVYEIIVITQSGVYAESEIARSSSKTEEETEKSMPEGFDLELKDVYLKDISQNLFISNVCVNGNTSINDLKEKKYWISSIPSKYVIEYENVKYTRDNGAIGEVENLKNGECMEYGWTISDVEKPTFNKSKKITVYLDYSNELIESNENNNKIIFEIEEEVEVIKEETTIGCFDSDGGRDGKVKGYTQGYGYIGSIYENELINFTDKCWIIGDENKGLTEYQCSGDRVFWQHAECEYWLGQPGTCSEGVCIEYNEDKVEIINYIYNLMLNRDATNNELEQNIDFIGESINQTYNLLNSVYSTNEYQDKIISLTNEEYVNLMYEDLLKRDADQGGLEFWIAVIESGSTKSQLFNEFITVEEFHTTNSILFN